MSGCDEERCVVVGMVCDGSEKKEQDRTISCRVGVKRRTSTTKQSSIDKVLDSGIILDSSCQRMNSHHFCSFIFMHLQVKAALDLRCESDMTQKRLALILSLSIQSIH